MPNIEFIWRIHPIMDFKSLKNKFPLLKMIPKNITISNQSIISDLKNVNFALYRGSSSIIQAVTFGVRPVYLKIQDEITIDPLYEVEELRESVINPDDFKLVTGRENKNLHRLKSYCEKLYMPLDVTELIPLINSKKY